MCISKAENKAGAGAGLAKGVKGTLTGALDSQNHHADATSSITTNTDVWRVKVKEGNTTRDVYESGGSRVGGLTATGTPRDPGASQGLSILAKIKADQDFAEAAVEAAQKNGQAQGFDLRSDRFGRGTEALTAALK
jgi:hypothetical protein